MPKASIVSSRSEYASSTLTVAMSFSFLQYAYVLKSCKFSI